MNNFSGFMDWNSMKSVKTVTVKGASIRRSEGTPVKIPEERLRWNGPIGNILYITLTCFQPLKMWKKQKNETKINFKWSCVLSCPAEGDTREFKNNLNSSLFLIMTNWRLQRKSFQTLKQQNDFCRFFAQFLDLVPQRVDTHH